MSYEAHVLFKVGMLLLIKVKPPFHHVCSSYVVESEITDDPFNH